MRALTKHTVHDFCHRWIVVIENFEVNIDEIENRFEYANYASLGMAQDVRDRINYRAKMTGERVKASIMDKQMWNF